MLRGGRTWEFLNMESTMARTIAKQNGTKPKVFDISQRFARDTVEVPIYDPVDLSEKIDTGIRIGIKSVYSKEARNAALAARAKIELDKDGKVISSEADTTDAILEQTIGATVYWKADDDEYSEHLLISGEKIPCNPGTVRQLYTDPQTAWIQRQVQAAYLDLAGFFGPPKTA
jgi:hypothetical protein